MGTDSETANKGCRNDPYFVLALQGEVGNREGFRARLDDNTTERLCLEEPPEADRRYLQLRKDVAVCRTDTDLGLPSTEIDTNMLHSCRLVMHCLARLMFDD